MVSAEKMKKITILAILFCVMFLCSGAYAAIAGSSQLVVVSSANYRGSSIGVSKSIATDSSGNIFVTGSYNTSVYLTIKYTPGLSESFCQTATFTRGTSGDEPHGITLDSNGDVVVVGQIKDASIYSIHVRKYKNDIDVLVATTTYSANPKSVSANAVATDAQNNIYVTGYINRSGGNNNIITLKYSKDLVLLNTVVYQGGDDNNGNAIAVDSKGNIFVAGESLVSGVWNFCVIKYNSSLIQQQVYLLNNGQEYRAYSIAVDSKDNVIVAGKRINPTTSSFEYFTIKLDNAMSLLASASYNSGISGGSGGENIANAVAIDSLDNIVVTGQSHNGSNRDYLTIKYDSSLNVLSSDIYDSGFEDKANAVAIDINNNIIVTGVSNSDYFTVKYNGTPLISAITQAYQGETGDITLSGKCFDAGAKVSYADSGISTNSIDTSAIPSQIFSNVTVGANVLLGLTTATVTNANGEKSSRNDLLDIAYKKTVAFDVDTVITKPTQSGEIIIDIPAYAYAQNEALILSANASKVTTSGGAKYIGVGMNTTITPDESATKDITVILKYNDSFATGLDEGKFIIAYYDDSTLSWIELPSTPYPAENKVVTRTKLLGKRFVILQAQHSVNTFITGTRVYPNPYKPNSLGEYGMSSYGDGVVFADVVKNFKLKIFNVAGELIYTKDVISDANDNYFWDTKCDNGAKAASGVYIFIVEDTNDSSNKTKGKFSIIR